MYERFFSPESLFFVLVFCFLARKNRSSLRFRFLVRNFFVQFKFILFFCSGEEFFKDSKNIFWGVAY